MPKPPPDPSLEPPPRPGTYAKSAVDSIVSAYYPREVAAVDGARSRAQSAYAIASTLAGVLVGAGLLTTLEDRPWAVRTLGSFALAAWLLAAGLYLRAVASPLASAHRDAAIGAAAFVDSVLERANAERKEIDRRLRSANRASMVALILTASTVVTGLFAFDKELTDVTVVLTEEGGQAIDAICSQAEGTLVGRVTKASLGTETLAFTVAAGECEELEVEIELPRSAVAVLRR